MAVIVVSEPPNATKISDTAKKHSKVVGGERGEGVLNMAASTKVLPILDISLNGAFKTAYDLHLVIFTRPLKLLRCVI